MVLAMKFTPTAAAVTPEQQMQQKMMMYMMPVMMLWIMWSAPAGLLLYWFFGNIVSFAQQMLINRMNKTDEPPKEEIVESVPKNAKKVKPKLSTFNHRRKLNQIMNETCQKAESFLTDIVSDLRFDLRVSSRCQTKAAF
jgi:membrane protein insertase Oxa1/YidC/SpoIIIJ